MSPYLLIGILIVWLQSYSLLAQAQETSGLQIWSIRCYKAFPPQDVHCSSITMCLAHLGVVLEHPLVRGCGSSGDDGSRKFHWARVDVIFGGVLRGVLGGGVLWDGDARHDNHLVVVVLLNRRRHLPGHLVVHTSVYSDLKDHLKSEFSKTATRQTISLAINLLK